MDMEVARTISYVFAMVVLTGILIWGLKKVSAVLRSEGRHGGSVFKDVLSEQDDTPPQTTGGDAGNGAKQPKGSFSRVAGAIGAIALAATFTGMGYWVIYALFFDPANLNKFRELGLYFLAGTAMFMPYAFNRLSGVFKT